MVKTMFEKCESIVKKINYILEQCLVEPIITNRTTTCLTKLAKFLVGGMFHNTTTPRFHDQMKDHFKDPHTTTNN